MILEAVPVPFPGLPTRQIVTSRTPYDYAEALPTNPGNALQVKSCVVSDSHTPRRGSPRPIAAAAETHSAAEDLHLAAEENPAVTDMLAAVPAGTGPPAGAVSGPDRQRYRLSQSGMLGSSSPQDSTADSSFSQVFSSPSKNFCRWHLYLTTVSPSSPYSFQ